MATPVSNSVPLTGNPFVDGLVQGGSWQFGGAPHVLTYSFSVNDTPNGGPWTPGLTTAFTQALAAWSDVANITFVEQGSGGVFTQSTANIAATLTGRELWDNLQGSVSIGVFPDPAFASVIESAVGYTRAIYPNPEGDVFFDNFSPSGVFGNMALGGQGFEFFLHELGHALGLKHPHDDGGNTRPTFAALGLGSYDNSHFTVMSYNSGDGPGMWTNVAATPMPFDILAIQQIYGANMAYHTGNDTYQFLPYDNTIWDAGGTDTLDASNQFGSVWIDLTPGALSHLGGQFGTTVTGIAYNVTIENAIGSNGDDTIFGNDTDNNIDGRRGSDTMAGGNGNDTYVLDNIFDVVIENPGAGTDLVQSSITFVLPTNVENLTLTGAANINGTGNNADNVIIGNSGNNNLTGGGGNDTLAGGNGNDTYVVDTVGEVIIENPSAGIDLVQSSVTFVLPTNVENLTLTGTANINGTGNVADNIIFGNSGNNTLTGGGGIDTMAGGLGDDTYILNSAGDVVTENPNGGIDTIIAGFSYTLVSGNLENVTLTGTSNLAAIGNNLDNILISNSGIDALAGGPGNDVYFLNNAGDTVTENSGEGIDTVVAGFSFTLVGTNLENVTLTGGAGLTATGNAFANLLTSNTGIDTLIGGLGNDTYVLNNAAVTIVENAGEGTDTVMTSFSYSLAPGSNLENVTLTGFNLSNATGDGLNNILTGSSGQNMLTGGLGNDTLIGGFALDTARFNGPMSSYAITHTGTSGTVTGPDGTDTFSSVERLQFDDQSIVFVVSKNDFNGDLASDLVWRNNDGTVAIWSMQDATHFSATVAGLIPTSWHVSGTGDFNGDGKSDVLWHGDDGLVAVWTMQDATHFSATVAGLIPTSWHVSGTGDFNGDGKSDVLWHGDDGLVAVWTMQDATHFSATVTGLIPTSWQVSGTGDFNGDGKSDVLWHGSDGLVAVWTMQDATHFSADVTGMIPTSWQVGGTGDFNGDGKSDVLWHANDGTVAVWTMQDATHFSVDVAGAVPASWHIAGTPDVNGDGKSDVLWRIDNGQVAVWTMQDATYHTTDFSQLIPNDWMIA
jgi:Ca2+-binding RTX toxin-like protein